MTTKCNMASRVGSCNSKVTLGENQGILKYVLESIIMDQYWFTNYDECIRLM